MTRWMRRLAAEPLFHFALIGGLLYCVDLAFRPEQADPRLIRIDAQVYRELADTFQAGQSRLPTPNEMDKLVDIYVMNETLYREARSLELDHGDQMMRERMMQRMRLMMYEGVVVPDPSEEVLRAWFDKRKADYAKPAHISFNVIGLDGEQEEAEAVAGQANAAQLKGETLKLPGKPMVRFPDRPRDQMTKVLSEDFVAAVEKLPPQVWTATPSQQGWQVVQYLGSTPAEPQSFETVREIVEAEWKEVEYQKQARDALAALMKTYPVEREPVSADVLQTADHETAAADGERSVATQ